jgi:hypothetical protein
LNLLAVDEYTTTSVSTAAITGGCIGGVLIALAASLYLYRRNIEKPKSPTIYMYSEKESGDFIPFTADTMAETRQAEEDKKVDFATIYPTID